MTNVVQHKLSTIHVIQGSLNFLHFKNYIITEMNFIYLQKEPTNCQNVYKKINHIKMVHKNEPHSKTTNVII